MNKQKVIAAVSNPNVRKFLDLLAYTEGTEDNGYHTAFGGGRLSSLKDHPRYLKSFKQTNGKTNKTSAAGRYQFLRGTWDNLAKQYGLKDFSPRNQDIGAVALLAQNGALPYVLKGDWNNAVAKSGRTWASLPTSPHPQPTKSWAKVNKFLGSNSVDKTEAPPTLSKSQSIKLYQAYKNGKLDPLQRAEYEADVKAGVIKLPKNGKLLDAPKPSKSKGERLPATVVLAYNNGELNDVQQAELEADVKNGIAVLPSGYELKKPKKGFLSQAKKNVGEAVDASVDNLVNNGGVGNIVGLADAAVSVGGGLVDGLAKGYYATAKGATGDGDFWDDFSEARQDYENSGIGEFTGELATPNTETGKAFTDVIAIPGMATEALGKGTQSVTGSNVAGATVQGGLETLGMLLPGKKTSTRSVRNGDGSMLRRNADDVARRADDAPLLRRADDAVRRTDSPDAPRRIARQPSPLEVYQRATERGTGSLDGVRQSLDSIDSDATATRQSIQDMDVTPDIDTAAVSASRAPQIDIDEFRNVNANDPNFTPSEVKPIEHLLDLQESKPKVGGVDIDAQGLRAQVLKELGLDDTQVRKGAITGDINQLEAEKGLSKLDTEQGRQMRSQLDTEYETINNYARDIVEDDIGARAGASPESRGQVVIDALQEYKDWHKDQVSQAYKQADDAMAGSGGIKLDDFEANLSRNSLWQGKKTNQQLRRGIKSYLKEIDLIDKSGEVKPMSAKQAEGLRQYINSQWSPDSAGLIAKVNESIDMGVFSKLDDNAYLDARKKYKQFKEVFENPKGIAKLLDVDGINRKVSPEQVGRNLQMLATKDGAQFKHIYGLLDNLPEGIKEKGKRAKAEIQAALAESIIGKPGLRATNKLYMQFRRTDDAGNYKAKDIFGDDVARKLDTYVAGRNVLQHHDANPSGTATTSVNLSNWDVDTGNAVTDKAVNTASKMIEGVPIVGEVISTKIKKGLYERQSLNEMNDIMNPNRAKTYRQASEQVVNQVINTDQMKQIIDEFEKPKPNQTKIKVLQKKLAKTKEWKDYIKTLPPKIQKQAKNNADVLTMLTIGANQYDQEALAPTF